jgi:hypothetical protein
MVWTWRTRRAGRFAPAKTIRNDPVGFAFAFAASVEQTEPAMEQSIRNELPGIVKNIVSDKVLSEVIIEWIQPISIRQVSAIRRFYWTLLHYF